MPSEQTIAHISFCPFGVFAYNAEGKLIAKKAFDGNVKEKLQKFLLCFKKELSPEELSLAEQLKPKYETIIFEQPKQGFSHEFPNIAGKNIRANMQILSQEAGVKSQKDLLDILQSAAIEYTREKMSSLDVNDKLVMQAISAIDELDKISNAMSMRLREWYGFYFPEVEQRLSDNEQFAKYVLEETFRKDIGGINIEDTIGSDVSNQDLEEMKKYSQLIIHAYNHRKELERYVESKVKELAANMHTLIGGQLTAKLMLQAGSLEKLATFPSSTIQVLGAEKALFRFLKGQGTSPKYGLLFQSTYVQQAPKDQRGKIARILASKLSLAAKLDFYKGNFMGSSLKADMDNAMQHAKKSKTMAKLHPKYRKRK